MALMRRVEALWAARLAPAGAGRWDYLLCKLISERSADWSEYTLHWSAACALGLQNATFALPAAAPTGEAGGGQVGREGRQGAGGAARSQRGHGRTRRGGDGDRRNGGGGQAATSALLHSPGTAAQLFGNEGRGPPPLYEYSGFAWGSYGAGEALRASWGRGAVFGVVQSISGAVPGRVNALIARLLLEAEVGFGL